MGKGKDEACWEQAPSSSERSSSEKSRLRRSSGGRLSSSSSPGYSWKISKEPQGAAGPEGCFRWEKGKGAVLGDAAVPRLPGQCQGRASSYLSWCWALGDFGVPRSPPELSAHPWKDPGNFCPPQKNSSGPLKVPPEGRVGFVAITVTLSTKLGWDEVTAPSCTSLEGGGRVRRTQK